MTECIVQFHYHQFRLAIEGHEYSFERTLGGFGQGLQPFQAVPVFDIPEREVAFDLVVAGEQRRRTAAQRGIQLLDRDLVQVDVVHPELPAVADDELFVGFAVFPAELAGTFELHGAGGRLDALAVLVLHFLGEIRLRGMRGGDERLELVGGGGVSAGRTEQRYQ